MTIDDKELKYVPGTYLKKRPDAYTVANQYEGKWKQQFRKKEEAFPAKMSSSICFSRKIGVGALEIADILALLHLGFKGIRLGSTLPELIYQDVYERERVPRSSFNVAVSR